MFEHSVTGGKCKRSSLLLAAYKALSGQKRQSEEQMKQVVNTAACLELMQSFFVIEDDIMDDGVKRRGRLCWHRLDGVGKNGINDGLLLDCLVPFVLSTNRVPSAVRDAVDEARRFTVIGQMLDADTKHAEDCTWQRHQAIVQHKTSHYTYFTPLEIAALYTGQLVIIERLKRIAYQLGYLFQSVDDYMDCFGDESVTGKVGSDLREAKCTWVTCKAMEKLEEQPILFEEFRDNFGKPDIASEQKLKDVIAILKVADDFPAFHERHAGRIASEIDHFPMIDLRPKSNVMKKFEDKHDMFGQAPPPACPLG
ncbi:unnamed protein product [Gongylonema pulchrum]|uniref:Farnesyl pyrophosphate synthase n=1 Tax=Gongylonema pulchrum TaxID=637853 RepID=A0A3P7MDF5_9BILA|nr:unnamed protein product [Gongylonema pulchrum]